MQRFVIALLLAAGLAGCRPPELYLTQPTGTGEYQLGWQDGCDAGLAADGGWLYKIMYGFKKRPEMANNDPYKQGWNEGFTYCRFTISRNQEDQWKVEPPDNKGFTYDFP